MAGPLRTDESMLRAETAYAKRVTEGPHFSNAELEAMEELRTAGQQLEATFRAYGAAKERHQRALGVLHRLWGATTEPTG